MEEGWIKKKVGMSEALWEVNVVKKKYLQCCDYKKTHKDYLFNKTDISVFNYKMLLDIISVGVYNGSVLNLTLFALIR